MRCNMNKELIEKRKADLQKQVEQMQRNIIATQGAIQDCDYWLEVISKGV